MFRFLARLCSTGLFAVALLPAQSPVKYTLSPTAPKVTPGKPFRLELQAEIEKGWHLYSISSPLVPTATRIAAPPDSPYTMQRFWQPKVEAKYDAVAAATTESYEDKATFLIDATLAADAKPGPLELTVQLRSSSCNDKICLPPKRRMLTAQVVVDPGGAAELPAVPAGLVDGQPLRAPPPSAGTAPRR